MRFFVLFFLFFQTLLFSQNIEELKTSIFHKCQNLEGWASHEKINAFIEHVIEHRPQVSVEIGVFGGKSILPIALTLKYLGKGFVIGIDPWDNNECVTYLDPLEKQIDIQWWSQVNLSDIYSGYIKQLIKHDLHYYCRTIVKPSLDAHELLPYKIDFLHIDGNQSEAIRFLDVELYLPKVRSGGYICLNDTLYVESQPAIEILLRSCDVVKLIDQGNCIFFRKR